MCTVLLPPGDNPIAVNNIYIYIYVHTFYMGFKTWSVLLRAEHRLRLFDNRVLRYLDLREGKYQETARKCLMRCCPICTTHQTFLG